MTGIIQESSRHTADFERLANSAIWHKHAWLRRIRKTALAHFDALGFPTPRDEEWRYTNVAPIARVGWRLRECDSDPCAADGGVLQELPKWGAEHSRIVFVNGRFAPALSVLDRLPQGLTVRTLAEAIDADTSIVRRHLARHAGYQTQPFAALSTAFMEDGAFIHVARGQVVEEPIRLVFVTAAEGGAHVTHPRTLVVCDTGSRATIVEEYWGGGDLAYFTNSVTEIVVGENAALDHYRVNRESERALHVATQHVQQLRGSALRSHALTLGGRLVRNNITAVLDDEDCDCTLNGLYVADGEQHVDNHLRVEHNKPRCRSWEYFKGVLGGESRGVFSGRILVAPDAQKTDAKQTNMNLLLSRGASVDTRPQLEILADDVKCTHGATVGRIDEGALFYLRSRGISLAAARSLLVYAFVSESLGEIRLEPLRRELEDLLFARVLQSDLEGEKGEGIAMETRQAG